MSAISDTDIAVVGVACRFPDAWTPEQYWRNLDTGTVSMRELSDEQLRAAGHPEEAIRQPGFVRVGATLPGVADFAADFFGYTPREVDAIDPQQRIFLETCWQALESAGLAPGSDRLVTGVFASSAAGNYSAAVFAAKVRDQGLAAAIGDLDLTVGGQADFMTSRTAYKLGLRGPSVSVQTGCSSSLYSVHYGMLSLLSGESDLVLAGGATVVEPLLGYQPVPGAWVSEDGYIRSFDAKSSGTTYGSGVGVVALRRLADALADGNTVLAVLRGSAVGNDGGARLGYAAPNLDGVADVIAAALSVADVPADRIRYVEAHGTGTPLGDHIELLALTKAFRRSTPEIGYCGLGSVMSNIGHLGPAAGIAGLIKAIHVAGTGSLPPHPTFRYPRDPAELEESPFFIATSRSDCPEPDRHVLVNSMGVGGTNAAVVVAAPPAPTRPAAPEQPVVRLTVSARSRVELDQLCRDLADRLADDPTQAGDLAYTLRVGRAAFDERRVVTAPPARLAAALRLPRPPAVRTLRAARRPAVVVAGPQASRATLAGLRAALAGAEVVDSLDLAGDRFAIVLGGSDDPPEPAATRGVLVAGDAGADGVDEALTTAWLHGVTVDWEAVAGGRGRRLRLPTYPFQRKRYWPLDHLDVFRREPTAAATAEVRAAAEGSIEESVTAVWRELFDRDSVGLDDEFGALGGTSLLSVQMVLRIQQQHGVMINLHRAGGSRATVRRLAQIVQAGAETGPDREAAADRDGALIDADLALPLGPMASRRAPGRDVLLTGATGYLGAFLLHELQATSRGRIHCVVRARDEQEGMRRLREAAERVALPAPDPDRVSVVVADLRDFAGTGSPLLEGELADQIGHVLHCAARVVFTEPYRILREDNVLPMAGLLNWMCRHGIRDFSYVSTLAATGAAMGGAGSRLETRKQPLHPDLGGYGITKWVGERLLEKAEEIGVRGRVFRPGLIMAARDTGACNHKDLVWLMLASGLAVGAHPTDDRAEPVSPVDVIARAIVELALAPSSVGRVYHLADERSISTRELFEMLGGTGLPTAPLPLPQWQQQVADQALTTGSEVMSAVALYELEGHELAEDDVQVRGWQSWLRKKGLSSAVTPEQLRRGLAFLAERHEEFAALLPGLAGGDTAGEPTLIEERA
ncbi:thioester reductase domain-containing protein [Micromonospora sp. RTGN7]|uniref:thioester reductase domain-containing protein n=1 Tax=Micromonospora sp. RTGN7 TaxID=3016526 RepID=UPI0029FF053E|nr:thioester reductase domain-containing protein [Micromonospora sp. RTGN7]